MSSALPFCTQIYPTFARLEHGLTQMIIDVVIPAYNEEESIPFVLADIPKQLVRHVFVCNNASTDETADRARKGGAIVVDAPTPGYGNACLQGLASIAEMEQSPDIVVFLDGDYSDHPEEMPQIVEPILNGTHDLVIGSRALGPMEAGAMQPQQIFGNWLATNLIRLFYRYSFTDLGPFRAIRYEALLALDMRDRDFGWTVEMQVKAAKHKLRCMEVPVTYRKRIGVSKVSGTIRGTILAGHKILWTIFKLL
ncbi:MAG: glycosyltransferase family 2 protein [Saprospiraceae bacterium]|nr:glycosyltransferase family 2 protein [Saprospiraceae bacterium]